MEQPPTNVTEWLEKLGLSRYAQAFKDNDIELSILADLEDADLRELGVRSLGHRKKLLTAARTRIAPAPAGPSALPTVEWRRDVGADAATHQTVHAVVSAPLAAELAARGYVLAQRLGQGGMGDVYLARQLAAERDVAIKVVRAHGEGDPDGRRFVREALAIAALDHPHTVRLFDHLVGSDGSSCIVMEFVRGEPLSALLARERRLPLRRIATILSQVLRSLAEAHGKGIVHRDIKPANILLQRPGGYEDFARVVDFGLARWSAPDKTVLTKTGLVFGTPRYLSPEQIVGEDVGARSDLYSVGVILWEALAGAAPFAGDLDAALMLKHLKEAAPSLPADVARPPEIDTLLASLLAKAPSLRPDSAAALAIEFDKISRGASRPSDVITHTPSQPALTERRQVICVGINLFDERSGVSDTEEHALLARGTTLVDTLAKRHGGHLIDRRGAELTLAFGAPSAHRDDADRALVFCVDLHGLLARADAQHRPRIGVADGQAVCGGSGLPGVYLVSGAPVNEARALARISAPGETLASTSLVARTRGRFDWEEPKRELATARARALTGRAEVSTTREANFVGRERELAALRELLPTATASKGRVGVIVGEAGMGKSALLEQVRRTCEGQSLRFASVRVHESGLAAARVEPLRGLIEALLDLPRSDAKLRLRTLEARVPAEALRPVQWPFLYHFLDIELPGAMQRMYDAMEQSARRAGVREALSAVLRAEARRAPLVLAIEDVQSADVPTLESIEMVCDVTRSAPLTVLLSSRIEEEQRWRHMLVGQDVTRVELGPLDPSDARALAERLGIPADDVDEHLLARAAGHPLFLAELLRGRDESDVSALPLSVQGLVQMRVDRLAERDRAAIQVAAVLGTRVPMALLRAMLEAPDFVPERLVERRFLHPSTELDVLEFSHALVREAVYESLLEETRCALHLRAAALFAAEPRTRAVHLDRAGDERAASVYLSAARERISKHELTHARAAVQRALEIVAAHDTDTRREALGLRGEIELPLGNAKDALDSFVALAALCDRDGPLAEACTGEASALRMLSRHAEAREALDRAEAAAIRANKPLARIYYLRGSVLFAVGEVDACRLAHERALELAKQDDDGLTAAQALSGLADAAYGTGQIPSAASAYEACLAVTHEHGLLAVEVVNAPMLAMTLAFLGEHLRVAKLSASTLEMATRLVHPRAHALALGALCWDELATGDIPLALEHAERALDVTRALGTLVYQQTAHYYLSRARAATGNRLGALESARAGLDLARQTAPAFMGAALALACARVEDDEATREALHREADAIVARGALSFNVWWYREHAIELARERRDVAGMRAHAAALETYMGEEPFAWGAMIVARARALAAHMEGARDEECREALAEALDATRSGGFTPYARALTEAIASSGA